MEQHKLLTLNGEYVKLYITTNSALPKLLKNSGSLVVYHDLYYDKYLGYRNISFSYKDNIDKKVKIGANNTEIPNNILFADLFKNYINNVVNKTNENESLDNIEDNEVSEIQYTKYNNLYKNEGNYLYLGNELIAGGWGFDNETQKDLAIQHLTIIPQYLQQLGEILNNEIVYRSLEDKDIRSKFERYILKNSDLGTKDKKEGGKVVESGNNAWLSSLYFPSTYSVSEKPIYLRDLPQILDKAIYNKANIYKITQSCQISLLNIKANTNQNSSNNIYSNYFIPKNSDMVYKDEINNILYVPLGSSLTNYEIEVLYNRNDTNGIIGSQYKQLIVQNSVQSLFTNQQNNIIDDIVYSTNTIQLQQQNDETITNMDISISGDYVQNDDEFVKQTVLNNLYQEAINSTIIKSAQIVNQNNESSYDKFTFKKFWPYKTDNSLNEDEESTGYLSMNNFIIFEKYNQIYYPLKNYKLIIGETPNSLLKDYPIVESQRNLNSLETSLQYLKSIENKIKQYNIDVDILKIIPKYLLYGINPRQINKDETLDNFKKYFNIEFINGFNEFFNNRMKVDISKIIVDDNLSINLTLNDLDVSNKFLYVFAIPCIYDIKKIVIRSDNNMWERDITGNFKIISKYKLSLNPQRINLNQFGYYNIIYAIYDYKGPSTNNKANIIIEFNLYENQYTKNIDGIIPNEYQNILSINAFNNTKILDSDNFNGSHWVDYSYNNDFLNNYIFKYCKAIATIDGSLNVYDYESLSSEYERIYKQQVKNLLS